MHLRTRNFPLALLSGHDNGDFAPVELLRDGQIPITRLGDLAAAERWFGFHWPPSSNEIGPTVISNNEVAAIEVPQEPVLAAKLGSTTPFGDFGEGTFTNAIYPTPSHSEQGVAMQPVSS